MVDVLETVQMQRTMTNQLNHSGCETAQEPVYQGDDTIKHQNRSDHKHPHNKHVGNTQLAALSAHNLL